MLPVLTACAKQHGHSISQCCFVSQIHDATAEETLYMTRCRLTNHLERTSPISHS